jgi:Ca2+-binding EF-hand superfamily protein
MRTRLLAALLAAFVPGVQTATAAEIDAPRLFAQLDADRDGRVTAAEAGDAHARLFARLLRTGDDDGDGRLSADEFAIALTPVRADKAMIRKQGSRLPGSDALVVMIARLDANGDRQIVADEVLEPLRGAFAGLLQRGDVDRNGKLDMRELADGGPPLALAAQLAASRLGIDVAAEYAALPPARREAIERISAFPNPQDIMSNPQQAAELFGQLDANGDKRLATEEAPPGFARLIERGDRDGDGTLSEAEWTAMVRRMNAVRGAMSGAAAGPESMPGAPPGGAAAGRQNPRQLLRRLDADGDGALSRDEAPPRVKQAFSQLDADGDGKLTPRELQRLDGGRGQRSPRPQQ